MLSETKKKVKNLKELIANKINSRFEIMDL